MNYQIIRCFDLEMCCWDDGRSPRTGEIIEIGVAALNLKTGEITDRSQYFVLPEKDEISDFCTNLTGITQRQLDRSGRPLGEVLESMTQKYGHHSIYAAWGRDNLVLKKECDYKGLRMPFYEYINLATLYRVHKRTKNKRFGMKKALHREGLEFEGTQHSGFDDAYNLARLARTFL